MSRAPDLATAIAAFERWRGAPPARAEVMSGGLRHAMFRLDDWVLRYYLHDASSILAREIAVLGMLAGEVPVPELVHVEHGDPPCAFLRYIEGAPFHALDAEGRRRAAGSIGHALARISLAPTAGFAQASPRRPTFEHVNSELVRSRLGDLHGRVAALAAVPLVQGTQLVHGDFRKWNVLVRDDRCVGIIDWEWAHLGSPLEDLGLFLRYERDDRPRFESELIAGFRDGGGLLPDDWRPKSRLLDLAAMCTSLASPTLPASIAEGLVEIIAGSA